MERLFFLLVMWLVTLLGTVWNLLSCFFSCLDCCKIGDIYPAVLSSQTPLLKEKTWMLFLFRSKPGNSKKCLFTPSKAFGRLSCSTQNTAIVPSICTVTNTENQQLWKTELHYLLLKKKKVKFLGIVNILWSIKYLKEVSWEILSQDVTFRKHEVFHMVHNHQDFTSYDSKILYHINKGHLKRPLKITCQ